MNLPDLSLSLSLSSSHSLASPSPLLRPQRDDAALLVSTPISNWNSFASPLDLSLS